MASITNYDTLVQALKDVFEDDSQEFADYIPTAIDLAEQKLTKEVDKNILITEAVVTLVSASQTLNKPTGYRFPYNLSYTTSIGETVFLEKRTEEYAKEYWPIATSVGQPKFYADVNDSQFLVVPTANQQYNIRVSYGKRPDPLSATTSTNAFTQKVPDVLYAATGIEMALFKRDREMLELMSNQYTVAGNGSNNEGRRERRDNLQTPRNTAGVQNTLKGEV